jgi:putative hydrolase of the HAD superfamily
MMKYDWVLFDADQTLFEFNGFEALRHAFATFGVDFTQADHDKHHSISAPLWKQYQNGEITAHDIKVRRFSAWAKTLKTTPETINSAYMTALVTQCPLLPNVLGLLTALAENNIKMGIITNGFSDLQAPRLMHENVDHFFEWTVVSENVGKAKPALEIFEAAWLKMGSPKKNRILMVGDNVVADIGGGQHFGFDTAWLNPEELVCPLVEEPTFTVTKLTDLIPLILA